MTSALSASGGVNDAAVYCIIPTPPNAEATLVSMDEDLALLGIVIARVEQRALAERKPVVRVPVMRRRNGVPKPIDGN